MSFLDDLLLAETKIGQIIEHAGNPASLNEFYRVIGDGLLSFAKEMPEDPEAIDEAVNRIMRMAAEDMDEPMRKELGSYIKQSLTSTMDLYKDKVDVSNVPEAVRRSKIAEQLESRFTELVAEANDELKVETKSALQDLFLEKIDRDTMEQLLAKKLSMASHHARTEAQTMVAAYTQLSRNQLSIEADLNHFLYYGHLVRRSRHFCRIHINGVFTRAQIEQMDNGMLNPVMIYIGGFNCIHSLPPVDPKWIKADQLRTGMKARRISIDKKGKRFITVIASNKAFKRLSTQLDLKGDYSFINAKSNDTGYVGIHPSWDALYDRSRGNKRKDLDIERGVADMLADLGHESILDPRYKNNFGGPVDLIVNGELMEIKTPIKPYSTTAFNRIAKSKKNEQYQSDSYIINLIEEMDKGDLADLDRMIKSWLSRHDDKSVYILNQSKRSYKGV